MANRSDVHPPTMSKRIRERCTRGFLHSERGRRGHQRCRCDHRILPARDFLTATRFYAPYGGSQNYSFEMNRTCRALPCSGRSPEEITVCEVMPTFSFVCVPPAKTGPRIGFLLFWRHSWKPLCRSTSTGIEVRGRGQANSRDCAAEAISLPSSAAASCRSSRIPDRRRCSRRRPGSCRPETSRDGRSP
jgi:hypothetical protein